MQKFFLALSIVGLIGAATIPIAQAGRGYAATNGAGVKGRSGGYESESGARRKALAECEIARHRGEAACHVLACNPRITTKAGADRLWPLSGNW
jgi:hypothetical protein